MLCSVLEQRNRRSYIMEKVKAQKRNGELDFFKLLFCIVVISFHSGYFIQSENGYFKGGSIAVDFFFVVLLKNYFFNVSQVIFLILFFLSFFFGFVHRCKILYLILSFFSPLLIVPFGCRRMKCPSQHIYSLH